MTIICGFCHATTDEVKLILCGMKHPEAYICYECVIAAARMARKYFAGEVEYQSWLLEQEPK